MKNFFLGIGLTLLGVCGLLTSITVGILINGGLLHSNVITPIIGIFAGSICVLAGATLLYEKFMEDIAETVTKELQKRGLGK